MKVGPTARRFIQKTFSKVCCGVVFCFFRSTRHRMSSYYFCFLSSFIRSSEWQKGLSALFAPVSPGCISRTWWRHHLCGEGELGLFSGWTRSALGFHWGICNATLERWCKAEGIHSELVNGSSRRFEGMLRFPFTEEYWRWLTMILISLYFFNWWWCHLWLLAFSNPGFGLLRLKGLLIQWFSEVCLLAFHCALAAF